ncbi:hypothetical protein JYU16_01145 [bacterium AH-315-M05]|nr:hypothetical protein [bacterium AH-315-M05]
MKAINIWNNPELVKKLALEALGKQASLSQTQQGKRFGKLRTLTQLIKERRKTRKAIEDLWHLGMADRSNLALMVTVDKVVWFEIYDAEAITNTMDYLECFLESREDYLTRKINSFEV